MDVQQPYHADRSLKGKLRRHGVRLMHRRPARARAGRAMISFCFDDAPLSALTTGAQVLEHNGVRGTYFVCGGTAGQEATVGRLGEAEHVSRVHAAGHEIGCHTFSHMDCSRASPPDLAHDLERNAETFAAWRLPPPVSFAYPFGEVGPAAKRLLAARFPLARAIHRGLVERGGDLAQTPSIGLEGEDGEATAWRWMEQAERRQAWLILFTHGVEDRISPYGCSVDALERLVTGALARGMEVVTVADGARRMRAIA